MLKNLSLPEWERAGVRVNKMIFQALISPSPLSPPARGGEVLLVSRLSILRKPSIFRRYKSGDDCVIGDTWHAHDGRFEL
jgi:hypothetical protein